MSIPEELFHKIMQYNSHPVADLVKANIQTVQASGQNQYGSSSYSDMYFNCMEEYWRKRFKQGSWLWLSKTKRAQISSGRYPYHLKHKTNERVWFK